MNRGKLIIISGFSGSGKGTVVKGLVDRYGYSLSISATTRAPRPGEEDGREYYFKTVDEFKTLIDYNGLIEWAQYVDNYYGTPRKFVENEIAEGRDVILEIEVQGARKVREQYPDDSVLIFLTTPDAKTLRSRLEGRGSEEAEVINKRIRRAAEETGYMKSYDYIVVNDDLDTCITDVNGIIRSKRFELASQLEFADEIAASLEEAVNTLDV